MFKFQAGMAYAKVLFTKNTHAQVDVSGHRLNAGKLKK
jgi:hypothetical protein